MRDKLKRKYIELIYILMLFSVDKTVDMKNRKTISHIPLFSNQSDVHTAKSKLIHTHKSVHHCLTFLFLLHTHTRAHKQTRKVIYTALNTQYTHINIHTQLTHVASNQTEMKLNNLTKMRAA